MMDWGAVGVIVAALVTQGGALMVAVIRGSRRTGERLTAIEKRLDVGDARLIDRDLCDGRMGAARQDWTVQCERHKEQCESDRQALHVAHERLAGRLQTVAARLKVEA